MKHNEYRVIGVMSGTSLDGIDLAYLHFTKAKTWQYKILITKTVPYTDQWKQRLNAAINLPENELKKINTEYTELLSQVILSFINENKINQIDGICSHGHTVLHQPENGITLQIGNLSLLSEKLKQPVICDFRKQDVDFGGQGAPLVPIGDLLLFPEYDFCVNLGGFANSSTQKENNRIAYDICPVNTVLNFYAQKLGFEYDKNGEIAAKGEIDIPLLETLNQLGFYKLPSPKSLGIEWVNKEIIPLLEETKLSESEILATFTAHAAQQIARVIEDNPIKKCLITGGGVYNKFLLKSIKKHTKTQLIVPEKNLIEYKEALIFGFLGVLKLRNEINVLSSVTGAKKDHSSGVIWNS